ncbi:hypothetical protein ACJMK2_021805, partial [Sinanodonta woodiana]
DCDFEENSCSWSIEGFRRVSNNEQNSMGGFNDKMHRNGSERFLIFDATNESYASLKSTQTAIEGLRCLNVWYIFRGSKKSHIQVFVQGIGRGNSSAIWETSMSGTGWRRATVGIDVQYSNMVTIFIRGRTGGANCKIGIDDIVFKLASCLDCNFLDGLCSWEGKGWNVRTKSNYAVTEFKSTREQSVLISGFNVYPGEKCFSFQYQIKDFKRENILTQVQSNDNNSWSLVWSSQSQHQLHEWNEISVTINVKNKSNIAIRFLHGNFSNATNITLHSIELSNTNRITTIVKLGSTDITTSAVATTVNTSLYYAKDGVLIGSIIGGLAFTLSVLLIVTYLY